MDATTRAFYIHLQNTLFRGKGNLVDVKNAPNECPHLRRDTIIMFFCSVICKVLSCWYSFNN
jgi:hypothetical protein